MDYIVNSKGEILGKHTGLYNYTIGQRKGLGISYRVPLLLFVVRQILLLLDFLHFVQLLLLLLWKNILFLLLLLLVLRRRQNMLNQFSRTELVIGKEGVEKLNNAKVAIFGLGGVGYLYLEFFVSQLLL